MGYRCYSLFNFSFHHGAGNSFFRHRNFKLGMIAPKNIKADHAFLVEDQQATEQKINDDAENIKPVYDYDSKVADNIKTKLAKALSSRR